MPTARLLLTHNGETHDAEAWAARTGVSKNVIYSRMRAGESAERILRGRDAEPPDTHELWEGAQDLPWAEDERARAMVREWHTVSRGTVARAVGVPERLAAQIDANPGDGLTLDVVGCVMGLSRERIRQIEATALHKLAKALGRDVAEVLQMLDAMRRETVYPEPAAY